MANPFTPGFGTPPTVLYGRETEMGLIDRTSFTLGAKHPAHSRATIITGNRGIGKTTLLTATVRRAQGMGIPVLRVGAKRGFLDDVHYAVDWLIDELGMARVLGAAETSLPGYRKDLVDAGILVADPDVRGRFIIAFPYMKEYALRLKNEGAENSAAYDRVTGFPDV